MYSSSFQQFLWNTNEIYFLNYWYPKGYFVIKVEEDMIWTYWMCSIFVFTIGQIYLKHLGGHKINCFILQFSQKVLIAFLFVFHIFEAQGANFLVTLLYYFILFLGLCLVIVATMRNWAPHVFFLSLSLSCLLYCCKELGSLWLPWHYFSPVLSCFEFVFCSYFHCIPIMRSLTQSTFDIVSFFLFVMFSSPLCSSSILCFSSILL